MKSGSLALCGVLLALVVIAGCSGRSAVAPSVPANAASSAAPVMAPVPLAGEASGQSWQGPEMCAAGTPKVHPKQFGKATGTFTHLGLATMSHEHCYVGYTAEGALMYSGNGVLTAANGDKIQSTYTGSLAVPVPGQVVTTIMEFVVTGGTGRFAGASGQGQATVTVTPQASGPSPTRITMNGTIVY